MGLSRTENASRNILWGILYKVFSLGLPFITRTVMIYTLGMQYVGLGSLFSSILQVLSFTELGIGSALVFSMYKPIAEADDEKVCALLKFYRKTYRIIGIVILLLGLSVMPFLDKLIASDLPNGVNLQILFSIYLLNSVIGYFLYAYKQSLFTASQRTDMISKIGMCLQLLSSIAQISVLVFVRNYYIFVIIIPVITCLNNICVGILTDKCYPEYRCRGQLESKELKSIEKKVGGMVFQKIGGIVLSSADTIVISAFLGLTTLAIYQNYYYIISSIFGFLAVIMQSIIAGIGNSVVTETTSKNYNDFKKFNFIYIWIVSWCTICLLCLCQPFMKLWVGQENMLGNRMVILFAIYFFVHKWCDMLYVYQEACGIWWETRFVPLLAAVVNLIVNIVLVITIGLPGILISTIISVVFIYDIGYAKVLFNTYFKKIRGGLKSYWTRQLIYLLTVICASIATVWLCSCLNISSSFLQIVAYGVVCVVVPNLFFFVAWRKLIEFDYIKEIANKIIKKLVRMIKQITQIIQSNCKRLVTSILSNSSMHLENDWNVSDCEEFQKLKKHFDSSVKYSPECIRIGDSREKHKWVGAQLNNGTVFAIPNDETHILCFKQNDIRFRDVSKKGLFKWTGGCVWNDAVYCFPRTANSVLKICDDDIQEIPLSIKYRVEHHYSGVCTRNGIVYQPPRNTNHILKIDLKNGLSEQINIIGKKFRFKLRYCGSILHPNGFIYFFPEDGRVIKLDTNTDKWCFIGKNLSTMCFDAKVGIDGNIYGFSAYRKGIMKIDVSSNTVEMIHQEIAPGAFGTKYGLDGCLYSIPGDGTCVWKYDVALDAIDMVYDLKSISKAKYAGGITLPNGEIFCVPANASSIMILKPSKSMIIPNSIYTEFYQDNY